MKAYYNVGGYFLLKREGGVIKIKEIVNQDDNDKVVYYVFRLRYMYNAFCQLVYFE